MKINLFYLTLFFSLVFFGLTVFSAWCPANPDYAVHPADITENMVTELGTTNNWSESPSIVVFENVPYIAYEGQVSGTAQTRIFFTYWDGNSWEPSRVVSPVGMESHNPILVINIKTGEMHMVWESSDASNLKVYYSHSEGFGDPWDVPVSLDSLSGVTENHAKFPFVALDSNGFAHVIFFYERGGTREVYYTTNLTEAGYCNSVVSGWCEPQKVGDAAAENGTGRLNPIFITVDRKAVPNVPTEPIRVSLANTQNIVDGKILFDIAPYDPCEYASCGNGSCESSCGETAVNCCGDCGTCEADTLHVVWKNIDGKIAHKQKKIKKFSFWDPLLYIDSDNSSHPFSVADNEGQLHIVFESEKIASNTEIYYKMLKNNVLSTKPVGSPNISNTPTNSLFPSVAVDASGTPKVVWAERQPNPVNKNKIYFLQWNQSSNSWGFLGSNPIWNENVDDAKYPSVRLDFAGNPFVAWEQRITSGPGTKGQIWMVYWSDDCSIRPGPNKPPFPLCTVDPFEGDLRTSFAFDGSFTFDDNTPSDEINVRWDWDFSDGLNYDTSWSTTKTAFHRFAQAKPFVVTLQARDNTGKTKTDFCVVDVDFGDILFLNDFTAEPVSFKPGETITFNSSVRNLINENVLAKMTFEITDPKGNLIQSFTVPSQTIPGNSSKEFIQTFTAPMTNFKLYYVHAFAKVDPADPNYADHPEIEKYLANNSIRKVFSVYDPRDLNLPETNLTGLIAVIVSALLILAKK